MTSDTSCDMLPADDAGRSAPPTGGALPNPRAGGAIPDPRTGGAIPAPRTGGAIPDARPGGAVPRTRTAGAVPHTAAGGTTPVLQTVAPEAARADWLERIEAAGEEAGYFEPLGARHWAFFRDEGPVLLVSFESAEDIRARQPDRLPLGDAVARAEGWSSLCLIAEDPTWYRDPAVYRYFDRLVDDAFFEDFDRVVFWGADMGAYAACAFSLTAPEATVLAVSPRATLDPARAGWDHRDPAARRLTFTDRYGYAPDMVEGTGAVLVLHDPADPTDAMHASLFRAPNLCHLRCRNAGAPLGTALARMGLVEPLLRAAGRGELAAADAARIWRGRRDDPDYLIHQLSLNAAHPARARKVLQTVGRRIDATQLRQRLLDLRERMAGARSA